jgi:hypothetical protein
MALYLCRIRGHSASILDWSIGLHVTAATGQAAVLSAAVRDAFLDMWNGVPAGTDAVKTLYAIDTLADDAVASELDSSAAHQVQQGITTINLAGTAAGEPLPPQVAVVLSKTSDLPTRRGRGRAYMPPPTVDSMNSGKMATASRDIFAAGWKNFMTNLSSAAGGAYVPVISHGKFPPAAPTPFNQIKVGDVFDTQRNRRNKLKEAFSVLSFP